MPNQFTWIPLYHELAEELVKWKDRQPALVAFIEELRSKQYIVTSMSDKDVNGTRSLLHEIDPFTFFGVFNRQIRQEQRLGILSEIKQKFNLQSPLPEDFTGIPILNPQSSWFFAYQEKRQPGDIERLWRIFELALEDSPLSNDEFARAFDQALEVRRTNINLTMGLFWIRPDTFLNLDQINRSFLAIKLPSGGLTAKFYLDTLRTVSAKWKSFPELSFAAWKKANNWEAGETTDEKPVPPIENIGYWLVGAYWSDRDPADQTARFLDEGIWENGYKDRLLNEVKSMRVNDKIAIKASSTQQKGLPFDNQNKSVSRMVIKAIGTIVANRNDGRTIEVEWVQDFKEKSWYFYTHRGTLWHVKTDKDYQMAEYAEKLIQFVWYEAEQDYAWFKERWWGDGGQPDEVNTDELGNPAFGPEDVIAAGIFLTEEAVRDALMRLESKKALILQGPPGVGKTFIARKLAYALMEEVDDNRVEMVQFHQSYTYDDFVRGYRPLPGAAGSFGLQDGVFLEFCHKAIKDPEREYVFIVDEINRGNLSQIFGELLMLIEADKRGPLYALPLVYREKNEPRFYVPSNLYIIGLMNLADRSLAMVDYALRRRFAYKTLLPQYEGSQFRDWLIERSMGKDLVDLIISRMTALNREIREDPLLGENYQIGHSYFCPKGENFAGLDRSWYNGIIRSEIIPLLKEYWFDNQKKAQEVERNLLG
jgi:5-methylcytosine-specific restriction enzyme B